ncbi:hypothetical protein Tco_1111306 [Tanacetum coccineum]|uniref:Uncharacterized protein n=1 Tax=Tanacetum coccineum TaxID=301880 RepID=A0ABQ5IL96_9ASTR
MTKQGNFTQRTPQAKKQSDQASRQISKQASGSANAPYDLVFTAMGPPLGTTQTTATITSLQRTAFTTLLKRRWDELHEPPPPKTHSKQGSRARLNFGPEDEVSPPRHRKERRREDNRRPPVFGRIGKQVSGTQTANLQNLDTHENNDWRISVHDRLGSRDVHSRLGQRRSSSESPPSSDSEDSRRKRRRRVSLSSEDTSDNEDAETGHWKSKNRYREDEDMSLPWRRQKVDAFTRRISDFSEDKRRRMPANVKTYDGTEIAEDFDSLSFHHGFAAALAVLVTGASQSRQHESHHRFFPVDTSLIHIESRKSPTKSLIDVGSRRISIFTVNTKEYHSDVLAIITRIMRRT